MASKKTFFKVSGNMSDTPATVYARIEEDIVTAIAKKPHYKDLVGIRANAHRQRQSDSGGLSDTARQRQRK